MSIELPDPTQTRTALAVHRPALLTGYDAALPGARAAVLARLWGALVREPIPGIVARERAADRHTVTVAGGHRLAGPADAAELFAVAPVPLVLDLDGRAYTDPGTLVRALALPGAVDRLAAELDNSVANLALARAARPPRGTGQPVLRPGAALATIERHVVDGHPVHPCCRTRGGMSTADVLAYAPEHDPVVTAAVLRVPAGRWYGDAPPLLTVHPWQREHVVARYPWLLDTGQRRRCRPLMSLRTLAPVDGGPHVKTAVDVQLTSAVRTVSPAAVHNGPRLSALLAVLTADLGGALTVLPESGAGAALVDGAPSRSLAQVLRQPPRLHPDETAVPLAALAAASPVDGRPLLVEAVDTGYGGDPVAFLTALARVLLPPLLVLLHRGVALEAHGQNTLLVLNAGRPTRLLYRDFGGVRVSPARLRRHGVEPPPVHGDLPTDDPQVLRDTLSAAVGVATGELVATIAGEYGIAAHRLWPIVAHRIRACYAQLPAAHGDAAALLTGALPVKATTAMRLAADPLEPLWARLDNPLAVAG